MSDYKDQVAPDLELRNLWLAGMGEEVDKGLLENNCLNICKKISKISCQITPEVSSTLLDGLTIVHKIQSHSLLAACEDLQDELFEAMKTLCVDSDNDDYDKNDTPEPVDKTDTGDHLKPAGTKKNDTSEPPDKTDTGDHLKPAGSKKNDTPEPPDKTDTRDHLKPAGAKKNDTPEPLDKIDTGDYLKPAGTKKDRDNHKPRSTKAKRPPKDRIAIQKDAHMDGDNTKSFRVKKNPRSTKEKRPHTDHITIQQDGRSNVTEDDGEPPSLNKKTDLSDAPFETIYEENLSDDPFEKRNASSDFIASDGADKMASSDDEDSAKEAHDIPAPSGVGRPPTPPRRSSGDRLVIQNAAQQPPRKSDRLAKIQAAKERLYEGEEIPSLYKETRITRRTRKRKRDGSINSRRTRRRRSEKHDSSAAPVMPPKPTDPVNENSVNENSPAFEDDYVDNGSFDTGSTSYSYSYPLDLQTPERDIEILVDKLLDISLGKGERILLEDTLVTFEREKAASMLYRIGVLVSRGRIRLSTNSNGDSEIEMIPE